MYLKLHYLSAIRISVSLVIAIGLTSCAGLEKELGVIELKLGHVAGPDSLIAACADEFAHSTGARMDLDLLQKLETAGMKINQADIESFRQVGEKIYGEFSAAVPSAKNWLKIALVSGEE